MNKPFVVVVTGRPGSGKTTLAHALATRIHCPVLCRDEFKEGYVHTLGGTHETLGPDINRQVYDIFFNTVHGVVAQGVSVVIEAAFQHKLWLPKLTALATHARIVLVICTVAPDLARARWNERAVADATRERFHGDKAQSPAREGAGSSGGGYEPPAMDLPTLAVDTTGGYDPPLEQIVSFALADRRTTSVA